MLNVNEMTKIFEEINNINEVTLVRRRELKAYLDKLWDTEGSVKAILRMYYEKLELTKIVDDITEEYITTNIYPLDKFQKALARNNTYTSTRALSVTVERHEEGYYIIGEGTQVRVAQFVTYENNYTRKPRNSKGIVIKEFLELEE